MTNRLKETIKLIKAEKQYYTEATSKDPAVLKIQQDLIAKGFQLVPDGIMGPKTKAAMDWQAKTDARDAGLQATKNMDPSQPAPAVPTDPAKKAAYDAAIKNMDPNQTAPAAPPAQPVAQPQTPAAPPAPKGNVQNPAVQDFTNKWFATQDKEAAQPAPAGVTQDQQDFKNMVTQSSDAWHNHVQQGNAAAFQPKLGDDGKPLPVAGPNGETTWRDYNFKDGNIFGQDLQVSSDGNMRGSKSMFEQSELARILQLSKW